MHRKLNLMATLGGVFYPVLAISGPLVMSPTLPPDFEAPPAEIADHLATHAPGAPTAFGASLEFTGLLIRPLRPNRTPRTPGSAVAHRCQHRPRPRDGTSRLRSGESHRRPTRRNHRLDRHVQP
jgi:hypothetical protein